MLLHALVQLRLSYLFLLIWWAVLSIDLSGSAASSGEQALQLIVGVVQFKVRRKRTAASGLRKVQ